MHLSTIEFDSLFLIRHVVCHTLIGIENMMNALKHDEYVSNPPILMSDFISKMVKEDMTTLPFAHFFQNNPILVPVPNSSLMRPGTLWVPQRLANALIKQELRSVVECVRRIKPLPKLKRVYLKTDRKLLNIMTPLRFKKYYHCHQMI